MIQLRGRRLVGLVARELPREFEITGDADAWPGAGVALLSRMTTTVSSILDLQFGLREADAGILGRSLYEHAVHFAWLAAEPTRARLGEWRKHDVRERLKADNDARAHGIDGLTDERQADFKRQAANLTGNSLNLADLARAADDYWKGKLPGTDPGVEVWSFRKLYVLLYRHYSGMAHPTARGLNRVTDHLDPTRRRVRLEDTYETSGPYGSATVVFALALYIAAKAFGWPRADDVSAAFSRNP